MYRKYEPEPGDNMKPIPFVRELMKGSTEEEIEEAEYNFRRYVALLMRIADRLEREEQEVKKQELSPENTEPQIETSNLDNP